MHQLFVGIDVSKGRHTAAVVDEQDQIRLRDLAFSDDARGYRELLEAVKRLPKVERVHVCLEATGNYGHRLAAFLQGQPGFCVSMINPRQSHHFAKVLMMRTKTDGVDAVLLARYARALEPRVWQAQGDPTLAALTRNRRSLQQSLTARVNALRSLLERVNPAVEREFKDISCPTALAVLKQYLTGARLLRARLKTLADVKSGQRRLGPVRAGRLKSAVRQIPGQQGSGADGVLVRELLAVIRQLQRSLGALEAEIADQVEGHLLLSIEGVGPQTAAVALGELPVQQLETDRQAVAFAGMNPRLRQSGRFAGKVKLSKCGPPQLRHALYMGTLAALHKNTVLQAYYQRKLAEGKAPKAALIACMTKLLRIIFAVLKTGRPFDQEYEARRCASHTLALQTA
jgi:transposase